MFTFRNIKKRIYSTINYKMDVNFNEYIISEFRKLEELEKREFRKLEEKTKPKTHIFKERYATDKEFRDRHIKYMSERIPCPDCGFVTSRCNLSKHKKSRNCKKRAIDNRHEIIVGGKVYKLQNNEQLTVGVLPSKGARPVTLLFDVKVLDSVGSKKKTDIKI